MSEPTPRPYLDGFTVSWDPLNREWVAVSRSRRYRLTGRTATELYAKRWELYGRILAQFQEAIREVFPPLQDRTERNSMHTPPGWIRLDMEADGVALFKRQGEPAYVGTSDMDQLRFIGAALVRFEHMSPAEFVSFVTEVG